MSAPGLLVNIDVENLEQATAFYCEALGLRVGRRQAAGASLERDAEAHPWGCIALLADPFGNGFCLLQFTGRGYDEIAR